MNLRSYLDVEKETVCGFAARIGVSPCSVWRWLDGSRTPRPVLMRKIFTATDGAVTAADFFPGEFSNG